jgi:hypothetical protein
MEEVNLSLCKGFPSTLAIFERHLGDQHLKERLGNLTQTGNSSHLLRREIKKFGHWPQQ